MNLVEDKIVHLLTGKPNLSQVTVDELLAITDEQPFFSVAQLLLTQKMKQVNHPGFTNQLQKTALFFPNTFWLDQHLQQQPEPAGYQPAAPAPVNTYTPPPVQPVAPPPPSFESNPYAPSGYVPPASVDPVAPKTEQPWYANPVYQQPQPAPAPAPVPEPAAPVLPQESKPAVSINDAYAAYLPQQDILSKVTGGEPPATPPPAAPPAPSAYTPANSYTPSASYTPADSYNTPDSYNKPPEPSYTPASSYAPADFQPPATPSTPPVAEEKPKVYEPWYTNPNYQQPIETTPVAATPAPLPEEKAAPSVNDAFAAYMPQQSPAPATGSSDPVSAYTPPAYTPPPVNTYAPPPAMESFAPTPLPDSFAPTPMPAATPSSEPVAQEQPKIYDPWYTNPIYQQTYESPVSTTTDSSIDAPVTPEPAPETEPVAEINVTEPASTEAEPVVTEPVYTTEPEEPATPVLPEVAASVEPVVEEAAAPTTTEAIAAEETPVAPIAEPVIPAAPAASAPEPVQEASPAVIPQVTANSTLSQPSPGNYRLARPPVIEVSEENATAQASQPAAAPMSIVEIAEAASAEAEEATAPEVDQPAPLTEQDFAAAGIVAVTSSVQDEALPPLDDNTDAPETEASRSDDRSSSSIPNMRLAEMLQTQAASFAKPLDESAAKLPFGLEPYMIDYFASQGINLEEVLEATADDTLGKKVRKFTDWLRQMRRINPHPSDLGTDKAQEQEVQGIAALSIEAREILTESMADVLVKQGKVDKAIQLYSKLSFLNPAKTAYFAAKIIETSKQSGK